MKNKIGKMERLKKSINEIRNEKVDESRIDELLEILNEDNLNVEVENIDDNEGLAASANIAAENLKKEQRSEAEIS
ncbi:MAG: hypothetical protein A2381_05525 [Bdellovibrionales bacterium RIFOXYB1_FULL_37_110]|nr:MAG: hypothetical protein A2381_05525 [Bdellovibrionales bacterium RIFOXYB1_FULL_37_110]